jgi:tetrahydromethanopterin S-methyltransferase subunit B
MKRLVFILIPALFFAFSSCEKPEADSDSQGDLELKSGRKVLTFSAHLTGDQEVPAAMTEAVGQAIFQLSKDGTELSYKLIVANIENVRMAHIHVAPAGVNGGVVVWLYPSAPPPSTIPGRTDGILAEGIITSANVGSLAGSSLSGLIALMVDGQTYVNVHTDQYPPGEIRGQIRLNGPAK